MRQFVRWLAAAVALTAATGTAGAEPCLGNLNALGISRVMSVSARHTPLIGSHDYGVTLPLAEGEVVLTFDDGPRPPYTNHVLKALADECVQAVFFMVGRQATAHPDMVQQIHAAGHTIGTHTQSHPLHRMSPFRAMWEIDNGIASVGAALGSRPMMPFFRFPGLFRTPEAENHLRTLGVMAWSVDVDSYDRKRIGLNAMLQHTLSARRAPWRHPADARRPAEDRADAAGGTQSARLPHRSYRAGRRRAHPVSGAHGEARAAGPAAVGQAHARAPRVYARASRETTGLIRRPAPPPGHPWDRPMKLPFGAIFAPDPFR